jgi:hypothetical protein
MDLYGNRSRNVKEFQLLDSQKWTKMKNLSQKPIQLGMKNLKKLMKILPDVGKNPSKNLNLPLKSDLFSNLSNYEEIFNSG